MLRQVTCLAVFFMMVGLGFLVAGVVIFGQTRAFVSTAVRVTGRVVDLEYTNYGGSHGGGYVTVFAFKDGSGLPQTNRTSFAQDPPTHQIGAKIMVLYATGSPESAQIQSFNTLWFLPAILGGFGVCFFGLGAFALRAGRKTYGEPGEQDTG
jgi:hypothetical protein